MLELALTTGSIATRRGGAAAFDPATLWTGAAGFWYDIDPAYLYQTTDTSTPAVVGQPVGRITDRSGNGNHATQGTLANRPILRQSGSLYYLEFDGSNDTYPIFAGASFQNADASGFNAQVAGVSFDNATGVEFVFGATTLRQDFRKNENALENLIVNGSGASTDVGPTISAGVPLVFSATIGTGPVLNAKKNGASNGTTALAGTPNTGLTDVHLGSQGGGSYFNGNFYGGIWLSRAPTAPELAGMESWAAAKAGVTL